ncbi:MAG: DUF6279 family lipoprotein [Gammaproteobacteria bacterium]|jgi:hypothetical protein
MVRQIVTALLVVTVSACSRTEIVYRNADRFLSYYARQTVDASDIQRERWQPVMERVLRHHREEELPLVLAYLDLAGHIVGNSDASPGAACLVDGAGHLYRRHAQLAVDLAAPLLADLDGDQISHLAEYSEERQEKAIKRYLDPDPRSRKASRQARFIERIEDWTGRLSGDQRAQIRNAVERIPDLSAPWLAYRAQQTNRLLSMIEAGADESTLREYLDHWWVDMGAQSAEYREKWHVARQEIVRLLDELATTLTDRQRERVTNRLGDLRRDLASFLYAPQAPADLSAVPACEAA